MKNKLYAKNINPVLNLYNINPNYYHTYLHVLDCINKFNKYFFELDDEYDKLQEYVGFDDDLGLHKSFFNNVFMWHDAVYIPGATNNEELSAKEYKKFCIKTTGNVNYNVVEAIMMTKFGADINNMNANASFTIGGVRFRFFCKIIHDIDWLGFANYEELVKNERKIINEAIAFTNYSRDEIKYKRLKFYEMIVNTDIYLTETFKKFNDIAKKNIQIRIKKLKKALNIKD